MIVSDAGHQNILKPVMGLTVYSGLPVIRQHLERILRGTRLNFLTWYSSLDSWPVATNTSHQSDGIGLLAYRIFLLFGQEQSFTEARAYSCQSWPRGSRLGSTGGTANSIKKRQFT